MNNRIVPLVPANIFWIARCPVPTVTGLALKTGRLSEAFARYRIEVRGVREESDPRFREQGFYHDVKTLFREGGNYPALAARAQGVDNTVVVGLSWIDEAQLLLARPGSGLDRAELSRLSGKTLGISNAPVGRDIWRAMAMRAYDTVVRLGGLQWSDVTLKNLTPAFTLAGDVRGGTWSEVSEAALLSGEVDIIYAKGAPAIALQKKHGLDVVLDINTLNDRRFRINNGTPRPIAVHKHLLKDAPQLVAEFLAVLIEAGRWAEDNPAGIASVVASETGTTEADVLAGYGPHLARQFRVSLEPEWIDGLQDQSNFLHGAGLIASKVDVREWIDRVPLEEALLHLDARAKASA